MKKYDFHTHFIPRAYLDFLATRNEEPYFRQDEAGRSFVIIKGVKFGPITEVFYDAEKRLAAMAKVNLEIVPVLTTSIQGIEYLDTEGNLKLARLVNDALAKVVKDYPGRFLAFGIVPFSAGTKALPEMDRLVNELGLKGIIAFTNVNGQPLDAPQFHPIYEKAQQLRMPIILHPTIPVGHEVMKEYRLVALVGFEGELTLCVARLIYSGILERYPDLKFIVSHLGGTYPFIAERIDRGYRDPESRKHITHPPSFYFKKMYFDTVSFFPPALKCTLAVVGPDNLVLGSDYPFAIGDLEGCVPSITNLDIPQRDKEKILNGNARRLLGLEA